MSKKMLTLLLTIIVVLSTTSCSFLNGEKNDNKRTDETPASVSSSDPSSGPQDSSNTDNTGSERLPVIPKREKGAPMTVCIDAGHGFVDPGCTSISGEYEKELTMNFAKELKQKLEDAGHRVVMLHDGERLITVDEICREADARGMSYVKEKLIEDNRFAPYNRAVWANVLHRDAYIDIFISIHADTFSDENVKGTRLYYCSENSVSDDSERLCLSVTNAINDAIPERKARYYAQNFEDAYIITKRSDMPAFLIELGFISNEEDAKAILDDEWRDDMAEALTRGFEDYFG